MAGGLLKTRLDSAQVCSRCAARLDAATEEGEWRARRSSHPGSRCADDAKRCAPRRRRRWQEAARSLASRAAIKVHISTVRRCVDSMRTSHIQVLTSLRASYLRRCGAQGASIFSKNERSFAFFPYFPVSSFSAPHLDPSSSFSFNLLMLSSTDVIISALFAGPVKQALNEKSTSRAGQAGNWRARRLSTSFESDSYQSKSIKSAVRISLSSALHLGARHEADRNAMYWMPRRERRRRNKINNIFVAFKDLFRLNWREDENNDDDTSRDWTG